MAKNEKRLPNTVACKIRWAVHCCLLQHPSVALQSLLFLLFSRVHSMNSVVETIRGYQQLLHWLLDQEGSLPRRRGQK